MKVTARQIAKYGGCPALYKFHVKTYGPGVAVDYDTCKKDFQDLEASLPDDADKSWIDWKVLDDFDKNPDAVVECSENVEYFDEYRAVFQNEVITDTSMETILETVETALKERAGHPNDFLNLVGRVEVEFGGKKMLAIMDHNNPKLKNAKIRDYTITRRDGCKEVFQTLERAEARVQELYEDWIDDKISRVFIEQRIVGDGRFEAWMRVS